MFKPLI
jgi:hypothetical protein